MGSASCLAVNSIDHSFSGGESGVSLELGKNTKFAAVSVQRADRFWLQAAARMILPTGFRTKNCFLVPRSGRVEVRLSFKGVAFLDRLCLCGSVWTCPICAHRIASKRRSELIQALKVWRGGGGHVAMLTMTVRHRAVDPLKHSLDGLAAARRSLAAHWSYRDVFRVRCGADHTVTALEINYGQANGWHPHLHQLILSHEKIVDIPEGLHRAWSNSCEVAGLRRPDHDHGLVLTHDADDYVTKWGFAEELAGHALKASLTPFRLLQVYAETGSLPAARLFVDFARATKGAHQLQWSRGAKAALGISQVSDEAASEVPQEELESSILLYAINLRDWSLVRKYDARESLLQAADHDGEPGVRAIIDQLRQTHRPAFFA